MEGVADDDDYDVEEDMESEEEASEFLARLVPAQLRKFFLIQNNHNKITFLLTNLPY